MYFGLLVAKIATRGFYTPNASVKINIKVWLLNIKVNIKSTKKVEEREWVDRVVYIILMSCM